MKCVGLLVLVILIQSINKIIQIHRKIYEFENVEFKDNNEMSDAILVEIQNGCQGEHGVGIRKERQSRDSSGGENSKQEGEIVEKELLRNEGRYYKHRNDENVRQEVEQKDEIKQLRNTKDKQDGLEDDKEETEKAHEKEPLGNGERKQERGDEYVKREAEQAGEKEPLESGGTKEECSIVDDIKQEIAETDEKALIGNGEWKQESGDDKDVKREVEVIGEKVALETGARKDKNSDDEQEAEHTDEKDPLENVRRKKERGVVHHVKQETEQTDEKVPLENRERKQENCDYEDNKQEVGETDEKKLHRGHKRKSTDDEDVKEEAEQIHGKEHLVKREKERSGNEDRTQENLISRTIEEHSHKIFPRICKDGLTELLNDIVSNFITSYSNLHSALTDSSRCASKTLSGTSTVLSGILENWSAIEGPTTSVMSVFAENLPESFSLITNVVSGLDIQTLATHLSGAIGNLKKLLTAAIEIAKNADKSRFNIVVNLNAATLVVASTVQSIVNAVNVLSEATAKAIESVSSEVQEAVVSLSLVLATVLSIVQSVFASIACHLSSLQISSSTLDRVLVIVDSALENIVSVVTRTSNSMHEDITAVIGELSVTLSQLTNALNSSLDNIQTIAEEYVSNNLEDLLARLSESVGYISTSVTRSVSSITSSLQTISATNFNIMTKVANQIHTIFKGLAKVSGTDEVIVATLIHSLSSIFNYIKAASNSVAPGIGVEASEALQRFAGNVKHPLNELLSLISGKANANVKIQEIIKKMAEAVQYVASTLTSITSTIYESLGEIKVIVMEAVLSLPFILSAVLYVLQWVLTVAVSIFATIAGSVSEILTTFTILIADTFTIVSKITSTISTSDSFVDSIRAVLPSINELSTLLTASFTKYSGVAVNVVFNVQKILSGVAKQDEAPTINPLYEIEGTVQQILNRLKDLSTLSLELSSTVSSLSTSCKICSSVGSASLKVMSNTLALVISQIATVIGSPFDILSMLAKTLQISFGHISTVVSKFSILGDVSVSLNVSVSNIQGALRSLIDTINNCSTDLSILTEPIANVAKTVQIVISTFFAIVDATSRASDDIVKNLSDAILNLPYVVSSIILIVQHVLGAAVAKVFVTFGGILTNLKQLTLSMSAILQRITLITANITLFLHGGDANYSEVVKNILASVSELNNLSTTSMSVISGVLANINVSLSAPKDVSA